MIEGQIVLLPFPYIESDEIKLRPAVLLRQLPNAYDDWLLCMITTKLYQEIKDLDIIISDKDEDYKDSGLKQKSLIRVSRLAVANKSQIPGVLGSISSKRLNVIKTNLVNWIFNLPLNGQ
jgi:mRNA interferase MazF